MAESHFHPEDALSIFDQAIDPMWLISVEENEQFVFRAINQSFIPVTGLTEAQVIGKTIEQVLPESSHQLVRNKYKEAIRTGRVVDYIVEAVHPAGVKYGEIRVVPLKDAAGNVTRILGIANDITDRELLKERLEVEKEMKTHQITAAAIKGQELERARVGRELHDNVNQVLTTVKLYVELCLDGQVNRAEVLKKSSRLLHETINEIRHLSKQLSAPTLGNINFSESLTDLVESINQTDKIRVSKHFAMQGCTRMEPELHLSLYRITQEQLTNIIKYAHAQEVGLELRLEREQLVLEISDDGIGFEMKEKNKGIGITNMISRASLVNGTLRIKSGIGRGTTLTASFPVAIENGICMPVLAS